MGPTNDNQGQTPVADPMGTPAPAADPMAVPAPEAPAAPVETPAAQPVQPVTAPEPTTGGQTGEVPPTVPATEEPTV